jgi:hypothetical protein
MSATFGAELSIIPLNRLSEERIPHVSPVTVAPAERLAESIEDTIVPVAPVFSVENPLESAPDPAPPAPAGIDPVPCRLAVDLLINMQKEGIGFSPGLPKKPLVDVLA